MAAVVVGPPTVTAHSHSGVDGSGTVAHSATTGRTANDHHAQAHALAGADHTASGLTPGHVMRATGAGAFAFGALLDGDVPASIARAQAVTDGLALKTNKAGDTMTGPLVLPGDAASALQATPLQQVQALIAALVASAPGVLDTLNELAAALGNDPNFATTITTALAAKAASVDVLRKDGTVALTGDQSAGSHKITNLAAPSASTDAARKSETDANATAITLKVDKATLDAHSLLYAVTDDTPAALTVAASRIVGRGATGNIDDLTGPEAFAILGAQAPPAPAIAGQYLTRGGAPSTILLVNGTLTLTPFWLPRDIDLIAANVTTNATAASGATLRFVVYADTGSGAPAVSGTPLIDVVAAQTTDTTGDKTASVSLTGQRWVWAGMVGQGAPATQATVRSVTALSEQYAVIGTGGHTGPTHAYLGLTGAIPTPIGAAPGSQSAGVPRLFLRMA